MRSTGQRPMLDINMPGVRSHGANNSHRVAFVISHRAMMAPTAGHSKVTLLAWLQRGTVESFSADVDDANAANTRAAIINPEPKISPCKNSFLMMTASFFNPVVFAQPRRIANDPTRYGLLINSPAVRGGGAPREQRLKSRLELNQPISGASYCAR